MLKNNENNEKDKDQNGLTRRYAIAFHQPYQSNESLQGIC